MKIADGLIYLATELTGLQKGFDEAEGKTESWTSNLGGKVKGLLTGVVAGAATVAATAIIAIGAGAMDVSMQTRQAATDMAASLGIPREEAEKFADVAKRVYGDNLGDSIEDTAAAVGEIAKQFKLAADDPALETMTKNAFKLRDTFDIEVNESVMAAQTLMDNFGLSGQEAFDLITAANQRGLNKTGDLLDTINEYSTQFATGGASAEQFFSLLESGLAGGMLGTDKAADAFKEFRVRIQDGSDLTAQSLEQIGINSEDVLTKLANGETTVAAVFDLVTQKLGEQTDQSLQMQAGVGLLGTQFEDLGTSAATGLNLFSNSFANVGGSVDSLNVKYETFGKAGEGIWRRLTVSVSPLTDKLLDLVNQAMPAVMGAFDTFDRTVGPAVASAGRVIDTVVNAVRGLFGQLKESTNSDVTGPLQYWQEWAQTNLPLVQQLFSTVIGFLQGLWVMFGDDITRIVNNTFGNAWTVIDTTMRTIGDLITLALQVLNGDWEGAGETLKGIVTRLWDAIYSIVSTQLDSLWTLISAGFSWSESGTAIVNGVRKGIEGAWSGLTSWFRRKLEELRNMLPFSEPRDPQSPLRGLPKSGASVVQMFGGGMMDEMERLRSSFSGGLAGLVGGSGQVAAAAGGDTYQINVYTERGSYDDGRKHGDGVMDSLRRRGK